MLKILWDREELILALDLYFRMSYGQMDGRNAEVIALSDMLTLLKAGTGIRRSPSAVSLKLANLKRLDPNFTGKGMKSGNQLEEDIWQEFFSDQLSLVSAAQEIRQHIIESRKIVFTDWLEASGKLGGEPYRPRTVKAYVLQLERSIAKEFDLPTGMKNILGITDMNLLARIDALIRQGSDSTYRRDLRSAFQSYIRFSSVAAELEMPETLVEEYEGQSRTEGGRKIYISSRTERSKSLRDDAIKIHGAGCMACGFDFGQFYGPWGNGFAEVHHLVPFQQDSQKRQTEPRWDLIVLCANCHRMVHRYSGITLSLSELRTKIALAKRH